MQHLCHQQHESAHTSPCSSADDSTLPPRSQSPSVARVIAATFVCLGLISGLLAGTSLLPDELTAAEAEQDVESSPAADAPRVTLRAPGFGAADSQPSRQTNLPVIRPRLVPDEPSPAQSSTSGSGKQQRPAQTAERMSISSPERVRVETPIRPQPVPALRIPKPTADAARAVDADLRPNAPFTPVQYSPQTTPEPSEKDVQLPSTVSRIPVRQVTPIPRIRLPGPSPTLPSLPDQPASTVNELKPVAHSESGSAIGAIARDLFSQPTVSAPDPVVAVATEQSGESLTVSSVEESTQPDGATVPGHSFAIQPVLHSGEAPGGHSLPLFHEETNEDDRFHSNLYPQSAPLPGTSGYRASGEQDGIHWINPYLGRASGYVNGTEPSLTEQLTSQAPDGFSAWWDELIRQQTGLASRTHEVDVTSLVQQALRYSPQVQALQAEPEVQHRIVRQEEAAFDWSAFLEATYDELNDPVGSILQTGNGDDRFEDNIFGTTAGMRRRTRRGGELEISQAIGHQYNNSRFLIPNPQATSELELSFRQPLLSQSGLVYNESQIVLARISANMSGDEVLTELQNHLYRVSEAYWQLYRARAEFFQRRKLVASARTVLRTLKGRNQVDTIPRQTLRAQAAVARAESRSQRAVTSIRNAESQLRLLVNDPIMLDGEPLELIPTEMPAMFEEPTTLRGALQTALINRPDVSRAIRQMRASGVRLGLSKNELLPRLDFIVSSYVAGLQPGRQIAKSMETQFRDGQPGYTVGLELEFPIGNRQQRARFEQRQWELKRSINVFRATVETGLTEVEIAAREVETAFREMQGRYHAMVAEQNEASYLQDRFEVLPMVEDSAILLLQDLLDSYERLADEEAAFVESQTQYALSIIQLRRATGVLLKSRYESPRISNEDAAWMSHRIDAAADNGAVPSGNDRFEDAPPSPVPPVPVESPVPPLPEQGELLFPDQSVRMQSVLPPTSRYPLSPSMMRELPPSGGNAPAYPAAGHSLTGGRY